MYIERKLPARRRITSAASRLLSAALRLPFTEKSGTELFSEPLFIFRLPLPAVSELRKVKKEPHRAV